MKSFWLYVALVIAFLLFAGVASWQVWQKPHDPNSYGEYILAFMCLVFAGVTRVVYRLPDRQKAMLAGEADARFQEVAANVDTRKNLG